MLAPARGQSEDGRKAFGPPLNCVECCCAKADGAEPKAVAGAPSSGWLKVTADLTFGFSPRYNMDFAAVSEALLLQQLLQQPLTG